MKRVLFFALLLSLLACGETDVVKPPVIDEPFIVPILETSFPTAITAKGILLQTSNDDNDPEYLEKGSELYFSSDGGAFVVVPAKAFGNAVVPKINLLAVSSTVPNAVSEIAYRVEFTPATSIPVVPLELFIPIDSTLDATANLLVGEQNTDGSWQASAATLVQASQIGKLLPQATPVPIKMIKVLVLKSGDVAVATNYRLIPPRASVRIGEQVSLAVSEMNLDVSNRASVRTAQVQSWSVNDTVGGSSGLGRISETNGNKAIYTAPTTKPSAGFVTIKAVVNGKTYRSSVQILDSKGWVNLFVNDNKNYSFSSKNLSFSQSYGVAFSASYETKKASSYSPAQTIQGIQIPEYLANDQLITVKQDGLVSVSIQKVTKRECECIGGFERTEEDFTFDGEVMQKTASDYSVSFLSELQTNATKHTLNHVVIFEGPVKYSRINTPCTGETADPPININAIEKAAGSFTATGNDLHPKDQKYLRNNGLVTFSFSPPRYGTIRPVKSISNYYFSWFFPISLVKIQNAPVVPQQIRPVPPQFSPALPVSPPQLRPQC